MPLEDSIDRVVASWGAARPDLDVRPIGVVSRLARVRHHVDRALEALFAEHGLSGPAFAVLVTLSRLDAPEGVSQRRLMDELGLTSGTVSVRIDRLEVQGLVTRRPDPGDRRNALVSLTAQGRELFERVAPAHLDNERRLLAALAPDEQDALAGLLRTLLLSFEGTAGGPDGLGRLGLVLAPAHVAIAMRRAVGLPALAGLLVRSVEDDGAAAAAGLRAGDVLVAAGRRELRGIGDLVDALEGAADGVVRLRVVRGVEERAVPLAPAPGAAPASSGRPARAEHRL